MPDYEYPVSARRDQRANSIALGARKRGAGVELGSHVSRVWRTKLRVSVGRVSGKQGGDLVQACGYNPGACARPGVVCAEANAPSYTRALFHFVKDQAHGRPLGHIGIHRG